MTEINKIQNLLKSYKINFVLSLTKAKVNEIQQNRMKLKYYYTLLRNFVRSNDILLNFIKFHKCESWSNFLQN
jgi:hypothetical protein